MAKAHVAICTSTRDDCFKTERKIFHWPKPQHLKICLKIFVQINFILLVHAKAPVLSAKESSKIPKSNPKPAATSAREKLVESEAKAAETEASEVVGKLTKPIRASKHFQAVGTAQTAIKTIPRTSGDCQ